MERGRVLFFSAPCGFGKSTLSDALLSGRDVLRLNAGSQFGMSKEDLFTALAHRRETPDLEFIGIHYFVGTQRKKLVNQQKELAMLRELYAEIEQTFGLRLPGGAVF